jgi:hypothetical protein
LSARGFESLPLRQLENETHMPDFQRFLDKEKQPTPTEISQALTAGVELLWQTLTGYLSKAYDFAPEFKFYGRKYGWASQYRRSGKTLCTLFPEEKAFTALVTLGKNELARLEPQLADLSRRTQETVEKAHQYPDGKWLWVRVMEERDIEDIKRLIACKRQPRL